MEHLSKQLLRDLRLRGFSKKTQEIYLRIVRQFSEFHSTSPKELGTDEIKNFLFHLIHNEKRSTSTIGVTYAAGYLAI